MGGLVGSNTGSGTVTASYWDTEASDRAVGIGNDDVDNSDAIDGSETATDGATGKTGAELRAPTGYTGIYAERGTWTWTTPTVTTAIPPGRTTPGTSARATTTRRSGTPPAIRRRRVR